MARGSDINQRIVLTGADEVRRHLEEIGKAGERSGNQTRAALLAATSGANSFTTGARSANASSGQMRFALQNLSFQVNDVATSLASGGDVMRVFAQQGGQVFQVFQQGGGFSNVMRGAGAAIASFITPTTAAVAALAALGVGLAVLISRAASADAGARKFDVILTGMRKSSLATGKELERVAESFRDIGISANEGRDLVEKFLQAGGDPRRTQQVIRTAKDLQAVLGEGAMQEFITAAARGGPALEEFARRLGIVPGISKEVQRQLDNAAESANKFRDAISDALLNQQRALADAARQRKQGFDDLERQRQRERADLTRTRGTPEQELRLSQQRQDEDAERAHQQRLEDINREAALRINDLIRTRNAENAKQIAAYNETILAEAQKTLDTGNSLLDQISNAVSGSANRTLSPFQQAIRDISVAWNELLDTMSKSTVITQIINDISNMITSIREAIQWVDKLVQAFKQTPGLPAFLGGSGAPVQGFASGGLIRGPGTSTSDSVPIRASVGEYVNTAAAVRRFGVSFFESLNHLSMPAMPRMRMPRGFAAGGLVGAGGGGSVVLQFPNGTTVGPMMADRQIFQAVQREARRAGMKSAGKKPSTA